MLAEAEAAAEEEEEGGDVDGGGGDGDADATAATTGVLVTGKATAAAFLSEGYFCASVEGAAVDAV